MAFFALVHDAYHRGACWDRVAAALRSSGHDVVSPDLPAGDAAAGAREYAQTIAGAIGDAADPIVVGHSMGGLSVPLVPGLRPVRMLVYVAALIPFPGKSFDDYSAADPSIFSGYTPTVPAIANRNGSASMPLARAAELYYHDAPWNRVRDAAAQLRPQQWRIVQEVTPLAELPATPSVSIVCARDRAVAPDWCRAVARDRLGIEPIEINAGHCPMISKPDELAEILLCFV